MRFKHYGKTFQLRIETAQDLRDILQLDESLWVATSAPTSVFRCDPVFLGCLDSNDDGRVNTREVETAVRWLLDHLADTSGLSRPSAAVALSAIRREGSDGPGLHRAAQHVLEHAGALERGTLFLDDVRAYLAHLRGQPMNGDGVIEASAAADDAALAQYLEDVRDVTGGVPDVGGEQGVNAANLEGFRAALDAYMDWRARCHDPATAETLLPFGDETAEMHRICREHAERVEVFFALCRTLEFDPRARDRLGYPEADLQELDFNSQADLARCLGAAPLARPTVDGRLPLAPAAVNPLYRAWIGMLTERVLTPVLGKAPECLAEDEWRRVNDALAPYGAYLEAKPGDAIDHLPVERLESYKDGALQTRGMTLIEDDHRVTRVVEEAQALERLLLYHRHLLRFCNNFVSFSQLYDLSEQALFEMGGVVIDGRWFRMALKVEDMAAHEKIARTSNIFTIYLQVTSKIDDTLFHVAVPATSGTRGNICVGKRGVFFDVAGEEYNAQVVKIIANPISMREALVAPFVRLWGFILGKIEDMSGTSEKELQQQTDSLLKPAAPASPAAGPAGGPAALLVGLSVSVAALGSAFAFMTEKLTGLTHSQRLFGLLGAMLVVFVPVTLMAVIKLNRQDLSSLLEGCGWAVNARLRLNRAQRRLFTERKAYPDGAEGLVRRRWPLVLGLCVIAVLLVILAVKG